MRQFLLIIFTTVLTLSSFEIQAQQTNYAILSGENIEPGIQVYEYVREADGEESAMGTVTENVQTQEDKMLITYHQDMPRIALRDSLLLDLKSFQPIAYRSRIQPRQNISVDYTGTERVDVRVKRRSFNVNQDTTFSEKFDRLRYDAHWIPTLLYAAKKQGVNSWTIPVYSSNLGKDVIMIEHTGEEEIILHEKTYDAITYTVKRENSEEIYYYWIGKESGRMLQTRGDEEEGALVWLKLKAEI
ncbi:MAG: hypothetical protein WD357_11740 [Gracilimonas sp.]